MQKNIFLILLLIAQWQISIAQNKEFSGRILYKNTFFRPNGEDITSKLAVALGAEQDYYISGRNYKSILNGTTITMQMFKGETNKYYMVLPNKTAQVMNVSGTGDSILSIVHGTKDTIILGRTCKSIVITETKATTTYYYDPTLKVNKDNFKKHDLGNYNRYLQEANGALPIKYIVTNKMFIWDAEATKIEEMALTDKDFELSDDIKVKE